ncbi:MAG: YraN family protein [Clostridiales bacterium]|nr:YraN family protein [Clostridiales bacterium]
MGNQEKGKTGEVLAEAYLLKQGYEILRRRYRCQWGENDIIAKLGETLCFVEVKARKSTRYGYGAEAVTLKKMRSAILAAQSYLQLHPYDGEIRFDVMEVDLNSQEVRHIIGAFDASAL